MASLKFRHYATESALKGNGTVQNALNAFDVGTIVFIDDTQKQYIITSKSNNVVTYKIYYGEAAVVGVSRTDATLTLTFSDGSEIAVTINNVEHATSADTADTAKSVDWNNVIGKPTNFVTTDDTQTITGAKIFTNNVSLQGSTSADSITTEDLIVNGAARFISGLTGDLKGNVVGNVTGNVTGNVSGSSGSCTGNALTATTLQTARSINGTSFNGSQAITTAKWGTARNITIADNTNEHTQANNSIDGSADFTLKLPTTIKADIIGNASTADSAKSVDWANVINTPNLVTTDTEQTITGAKTFNNNTTFKNETDVESLTADSLLVTGSARFTNTINGNLKGNVEGNLTGNASTATTAAICTGNSATATALTTNAGSTKIPVYFTEGKPSAISITAGTMDIERPLVVVTDNNELYKTSGITANYSKNSITATTFKGNLEGNAATATTASSCTGTAANATEFSANKTIALTGDVTGSASSKGGWSVATTIANGAVTNTKLANSKITIAGTAVSLGGSIAALTIGNALTSDAPAAYATNAGTATKAGEADKATKDSDGNVINTTYIKTVTLASGTNNGTLKLTVGNTTTDNIAVKGLGSAAYTDSESYAAASHIHNYAGSSSAGGAANWLRGDYTTNGGQQGPNYFGVKKVGALMMNTPINGNSQYKDFLIMDCYSNSDVGGAVAFGVNRQSLGAYIMRSEAERETWEESAELLGTHNYTSYTVKKDGTGASGTWDINISGNASTATKATNADRATGDSDGNAINTTYLKRSGGTVTGNVTFNSSVTTDSITTEDLIVNGAGRFISGITGDLVGNVTGNVTGNLSGNASSATKATNDGVGNTITSTYATKTERSNNDITAASLTTAKLTLTRAAGDITANIPTWNQDTTGTAAKATADAKGNNIINTYATKAEVAALPKSMVIKGTLDASHALPTSGMTEGDTYIVGASGTYNGVACKVGDFFVRTSDGWLRVPAGDEWEYNENTIKGIKVNNAGHADTAGTAVSAGSATSDSNGNNIVNTYARIDKVYDDSSTYRQFLGKSGSSSDWVRTTTNGILPYTSGDASNGHSSLGTSSWYFSKAYIQNIYGYLNGNISGSSTSCSGNAATATNADKLDGYHADSFLLKQRIENPETGSTQVGTTPFNVLAYKSAGYPIYDDPEFVSGVNNVSVYNNKHNESVTITRGKAVEDFGLVSSGNSSGYVLKITYDGGEVIPGIGGFHQIISARANAVFIQIFRAMIPVGRNVVTISNPMGYDYSDKFITSTEGTGKWEWYARIVHCGNNGSFNDGGYIYLGGDGTTNPCTWYLSYCNCIDITKGNYDGLRTRYADEAISATTASSCSGNSATATKATQDSDGNTINTTYLKRSGGTVTGNVTFNSSVTSDSLTTEDLIVNGAARFISGLTGDLVGNVTGNLTGTASYATNASACTGNAATATKLQTARTIWGQSFDGSNDITGPIHVKYKSSEWGNWNEGIRLYGSAASGVWSNIHFGCDPNATNGSHTNQWMIGRNGENHFGIWHGTDSTNAIFFINTSNNVGIGTTSPTSKLHVAGTGYFASDVSSASNIIAGGYIKGETVKISSGCTLEYSSTDKCVRFVFN